PWNRGELTGLIDFAGFTVPPGTRRGVVPDAAAAAFALALEQLATRVTDELKRFDRERSVAVDLQMLDDLRRALRGFRDRLPHYELPQVDDGSGDGVTEQPGVAVTDDEVED